MNAEASEIYELMKKKGMTKDQLGEHFGLNVSQVNKILEDPENLILLKFRNLLEMMPD